MELDSADAALTGQFDSGTEGQTVKFDKPVTGRYFCLETLSAQDGRAYAAVAELNLLDASGEELNRSGWKIIYADSEEHDREDGSAENAIDGNPATIWHTQWSTDSPNHPHHLIIDLGRTETLTGFRYLPRPGGSMVGGRIKDYRIYVGDNLLKENAPDKTLPENCYLFGYFSGNGEPGLHLAYSLNGFRWDTINHGHSLLLPEVGDKLMRDPCLILAPDGVFHLVWTAAWRGNYIGYASSRDLVHWSEQTAIPVMTNDPATLNCWAPEIFWDRRQGAYLVYWASTVTNKFGGAVQTDNNRIYCTTTRDFRTFSETKLFFDPGFSTLDATMFENSNRFYLVFKDDSIGHLRLAMAHSPTGPFGPVSGPLETDYAEGPMLFRLGNQIVASYHLVSENRCGAVKTTDLQHWEDISSGLFLPAGSAQGAVLPISGERLKPLVQAGMLEMGVTPEASELGIGDWIWTTNVMDRQSCHLWHAFEIPQNSPVARAELRMTADNSYTAYLDGREIGRGGDANSLAEYDLTLLMTPGRHVLAIEAFNDTLDAGVILGLRMKLANGRKIEIFSDPSWRVVTGDDRRWKTRASAENSWPPAQVVGYAGKAWWQHPYKITQVPPLQPQIVHFWQQGWVLAILLLACLTVLVLWVRQGLRLALQTRAQNLLERERARIARDMHDDLGSGLTQLTLLGELVLRETPREGDNRNRLNELCARSRALLRSMDEIVWMVNPRRDTVKDFAAFVSEHAQEFLAATAIRCRQEVMEELPAIPLDLPQRRNLLLAVKEAIRNAARHSGANEIKLGLQVADNCLNVVVEDNGAGFAAAGDTAPQRNGLTNMKQRLADIGGSFTLVTSPGKGCRIMFSLPLQVSEKNLKVKP
ncbi:MAG: discoidin domain-containing protein [Verrucomicrobiae bacterium]|nr:discoidin domain-containing protein [Verrucomicrobiae bacterium]